MDESGSDNSSEVIQTQEDKCHMQTWKFYQV